MSRVSGSGSDARSIIRALASTFSGLGLGFRGSGFWVQNSGLVSRVSGLVYRASGLETQVPDSEPDARSIIRELASTCSGFVLRG